MLQMRSFGGPGRRASPGPSRRVENLKITPQPKPDSLQPRLAPTAPSPSPGICHFERPQRAEKSIQTRHCDATQGCGNLNIAGQRERLAWGLSRTLRQFVGDLFFENVFNGKRYYALAALLEERLYFGDCVG